MGALFRNYPMHIHETGPFLTLLSSIHVRSPDPLKSFSQPGLNLVARNCTSTTRSLAPVRPQLLGLTTHPHSYKGRLVGANVKCPSSHIAQRTPWGLFNCGVNLGWCEIAGVRQNAIQSKSRHHPDWIASRFHLTLARWPRNWIDPQYGGETSLRGTSTSTVEIQCRMLMLCCVDG